MVRHLRGRSGSRPGRRTRFRAHATDRDRWIVDGDEVAAVADCHCSVLDEPGIFGEPAGVDGLKDEHQRRREPTGHPSVALAPSRNVAALYVDAARCLSTRGGRVTGRSPGLAAKTARRIRAQDANPCSRAITNWASANRVSCSRQGVPAQRIAFPGVREEVFGLTSQLVEIGSSRQRAGDGSGR